MKIIAQIFFEQVDNIKVEILKNENNKYDLGFLKTGDKTTLFQSPEKICISDMTIDEIRDLKRSLDLLFQKVITEYDSEIVRKLADADLQASSLSEL